MQINPVPFGHSCISWCKEVEQTAEDITGSFFFFLIFSCRTRVTLYSYIKLTG